VPGGTTRTTLPRSDIALLFTMLQLLRSLLLQASLADDSEFEHLISQSLQTLSPTFALGSASFVLDMSSSTSRLATRQLLWRIFFASETWYISLPLPSRPSSRLSKPLSRASMKTRRNGTTTYPRCRSLTFCSVGRRLSSCPRERSTPTRWSCTCIPQVRRLGLRPCRCMSSCNDGHTGTTNFPKPVPVSSSVGGVLS
jgi:hypothetical protein